jgi:3-hydroxyisobutyrate dehydrogenase-like beta-hydroxyacid dehydrogenase
MKTIAILYPGEMGSAIASCLIENGYQVITYLEGRSEQTIHNAEKYDIRNIESLHDLISLADIVISIVPPHAVIPVAEQYIRTVLEMGKKTPFIDMNAKSLETAQVIAAKMNLAQIPFTNACIIGESQRIQETGHIYTSGARSKLLSVILEGSIQETYLGEQVVKATQMKMCFTGFNKIITASIFEIALAANHYGLFDTLFGEVNTKLPGIMSELGRLIPSYSKHIKRRTEEMEELSKMLSASGVQSYMAGASAKTYAEIVSKEYFKKEKAAIAENVWDFLKLLH